MARVEGKEKSRGKDMGEGLVEGEEKKERTGGRVGFMGKMELRDKRERWRILRVSRRGMGKTMEVF